MYARREKFLFMFALGLVAGLLIILFAGSMADQLGTVRHESQYHDSGQTFTSFERDGQAVTRYLVAFTAVGSVIALLSGYGLVQSLLKDWPSERALKEKPSREGEPREP